MKKILMITQSVDKDDFALGFFHRWLEVFSKNSVRIFVICLRVGTYDLPFNVRVFSLGKESAENSSWFLRFSLIRKIMYTFRFCLYIWKLRREYDSIFVHMNQEYVLIAGLLWKILGKKIYLWRNYHYGNVWTRVAVALCSKVFCTSRSSFTARFKKTVIMPVGVDTERFSPDYSFERCPESILSLGRISPDKNLDVVIEACGRLLQKGEIFKVDIYGGLIPRDRTYYEKLTKWSENLGLGGSVAFLGPIPNEKTPTLYHEHSIFVNASPSGMYDKTIFEAAACGCIVIALSDDWKRIAPPELVFDGTSAHLAETLSHLYKMDKKKDQELRAQCNKLAEAHSLTALNEKLFNFF